MLNLDEQNMDYISPLREKGAFHLINGNICICPQHLWVSGLEKLREQRALRQHLEVPTNLVFLYREMCGNKHFPKLSGEYSSTSA